MRLHTKLTYEQVEAALRRAKNKGHVATDVQFQGTQPDGAMSYRLIAEYGSRTHNGAFDVQLGVSKYDPYVPLPADYVNQYGKRQKTRRSTNGKHYTWAATWHEWGWFMAEIFDADPRAMFGNRGKPGRPGWGYDGVDDFDQKTNWQFCLD
jgi:hypothetical protein